MSPYSIFILRCWKDDHEVRFRLENPRTGEIHLFETVSDLHQFLAQLFEGDNSSTHIDQRR